MGDLRAALAIARKDVRSFSRYRIAVASTVFTPLYQFIIPAFLFGAAFAVNGRAAGLEATLGTDDLPGFILLGGLIGGLISIAFWGVAFSLRAEMDTGTLEPSWLTPTHHETFVIGRLMRRAKKGLLPPSRPDIPPRKWTNPCAVPSLSTVALALSTVPVCAMECARSRSRYGVEPSGYV